MAVYKLQQKNSEGNWVDVTLGNGTSADDEFVSKKEASRMAISAFVSFRVQIAEQDASSTDPIRICIPGFADWTSAQDAETWLEDNKLEENPFGWPILNCSEAGYTWITYEYIGSSTIQGHRWQIAENPGFKLISW